MPSVQKDRFFGTGRYNFGMGKFSIGDRVRVSTRCFDVKLHGAVGVIAPKMRESPNWSDEEVVWMEFDPWIPSADGHPIEAAEVDTADLDPA
jgi:hypothetical protein